jgi:hypothetical protein
MANIANSIIAMQNPMIDLNSYLAQGYGPQNPEKLDRALQNLGWIGHQLNQSDEAHSLYGQSLAQYQGTPDYGNMLANLANAEAQKVKSDHEAAIAEARAKIDFETEFQKQKYKDYCNKLKLEAWFNKLKARSAELGEDGMDYAEWSEWSDQLDAFRRDAR